MYQIERENIISERDERVYRSLWKREGGRISLVREMREYICRLLWKREGGREKENMTI